MSCSQTQSLMSLYLDGRVTGKQMQSVSQHLAGCEGCHKQFRSLRQTQQLLSGLGRRKAPPELALRLRIALSREAALSPRRRFQALLTRLEDALNGFMVPATAGALSAIIFFGVLMGFFALPAQLEAADDTPPALFTRAVLKSSPFEINTANGPGSVLVLVSVDAQGRMSDYQVISGASEDNDEVIAQLKNILIFTEFHPATQFGQPTSDHVVLSFAKINVRG